MSLLDPCEDKEQGKMESGVKMQTIKSKLLAEKFQKSQPNLANTEDLLLSTCPDVRGNIETEEIVCCNEKYIIEPGQD